MIHRLSLFLHTLSGAKLYFITAAILVFLNTANIYAQLSPGDLTKAHANLEGLSNCTKCHELGDKVTNTKCLDCHKDINSLISKKYGVSLQSGS